MRIVWFLIFLFNAGNDYAQQKIFSENFESKVLNENWQKVSGNWSIADVQKKRIAPVENGYQYVLCSEAGMIRLIVDIPDTIKATRLQIQFSYYTYSNGPAGSLEIEFHKRQQKDGTKGRLIKTSLPVKGRWIEFKRIVSIPKEANSVYLLFITNQVSTPIKKGMCFDVISITASK
jgi:hypothetical protein